MHCPRRPPVLDLHQARLKQMESEMISDDLKSVPANAMGGTVRQAGEGGGGGGNGAPPSTLIVNGIFNVNQRSAATSTGNLTPDLQPTSSPPKFPNCGPNINGERLFSPCTVGRYILHNQLDDRAMYKCVNIDTNEEFTCKIVNNDGNQMLSAHFRVDSHKHINELVEVLVCDRFTYLIFGRSYGDLHSYVRARRRLREPEAQRLFAQVADAVLHCHRNGVVLRDLKLRRFVFNDPERSQLKLESLEDVIVIEADDSDGDTLDDKHGCPAYVSPEILTPNGTYSGKAADVWSMGVMLYAMLIGRYPFHDTEPNNLFNKIRSGHYTIPDTVSSKAKCLIRSLLRHNPDERLIAEDVVKHPWLRNQTATSRSLIHGESPTTGMLSSSSMTSKFSASNADSGKSDQLVPEMVDKVNVSSSKYLRQTRN